ncbi:hypothetical protein CC78DRAFT_453870 [Lojkania enalia]|uniref:SRPBCC domain-containing protein n=1 Tax=Lojkania enalia TaxID=147567 RepID=A0A9P4TN09_9PLEO|nr:hypothetical protein CC78DRAFT_453870 [Didymosphaeria enalia]
MPIVSTSIEIAASPAIVRSVFLDFKRYKEWHQGFFFSTLDASKQPTDLQPGDKIKVDMGGTGFRPVIVENSPSAFQWHGSLYGIFDGTHQFYFQPSEKTSGGTTLVQKEDFSGLLSFLVGPGWSFAKKTEGNFARLNKDLKAESEKVAK